MRSFERYCKDYENIENYEKAKKDDFKGWHCHHRKGEFIPIGELVASGMYYDRPAEELIFLTKSEHSALHMKGKQYRKGHIVSKETKKKMSDNHKGMLGKHHSDESKMKMSESHKGNTATKGMRWYHNDIENIMANECPDGFVPGMLRKQKMKKLS